MAVITIVQPRAIGRVFRGRGRFRGSVALACRMRVLDRRVAGAEGPARPTRPVGPAGVSVMNARWVGADQIARLGIVCRYGDHTA